MSAMPVVSASVKDKGEMGESLKSKKPKSSGIKINLSTASAVLKKKEEGEDEGELGEE
jgi:hypothetical protein